MIKDTGQIRKNWSTMLRRIKYITYIKHYPYISWTVRSNYNTAIFSKIYYFAKNLWGVIREEFSLILVLCHRCVQQYRVTMVRVLTGLDCIIIP